MAPQTVIQAEVLETERHDQELADFSAALTVLSAEHGIGIAGAPVLFTMEHEDYERSYQVNDASELTFE